ncbi:MAG TPA: hypothetical protein VJR89_36580 [Polyangiales bacterium]|nr:hypothetical protein [Polyangiales bacterium]
MLNQQFMLSVCAFSLACAACGGGSESTGAGSETTPAAAEGAPATPTTSGSELAVPPTPEPAPAEPAAQVTQPEEPKHAPYGLLVTHKVKDYAAWKAGFDAGTDARKQAGFYGHAVMQGASDPNTVVIWSPFADVDKAKAFLADPALKENQKKAGVVGKPTAQLSSASAAKMDPTKQGLSSALITAKVKDFDAFKTDFESASQARTDAGIEGYALSQDLDDKAVAYVYLQSSDPAKLKSYVEAKDTKAAWKTAGVVGQPKVTLLKEVEMVMYP